MKWETIKEALDEGLAMKTHVLEGEPENTKGRRKSHSFSVYAVRIPVVVRPLAKRIDMSWSDEV